MLNINYIRKHKDLNEFQYLCERNAVQVLLWGYGVQEPLLLMRCGMFLKDIDFDKTGEFSTLFSRPILDAQLAKVIGEKKDGEDWDKIDEHLRNGNPVFLDVDVFEMPYKSSTYYRQKHGAHTIIVEKKYRDEYSIIDWYHPDYFYGNIAKEVLKKARLSKNEKNQISVFSGFSINASYRLLYMDKMNAKINLEQSILCTLLLSLKQLTCDEGGISFLKKLCNSTPSWLFDKGTEVYIKAAESFFFLDLELKFLTMFYERIVQLNLFDFFDFSLILNDVKNIKKTEEKIKNRLILSYKKSNTIADSLWLQLTEVLYTSTLLYSEHVISFLNTYKGNSER